jgi:hypothetical protein
LTILPAIFEVDSVVSIASFGPHLLIRPSILCRDPEEGDIVDIGLDSGVEIGGKIFPQAGYISRSFSYKPFPGNK